MDSFKQSLIAVLSSATDFGNQSVVGYYFSRCIAVVRVRLELMVRVGSGFKVDRVRVRSR